jgi:hypothetical protein
MCRVLQALCDGQAGVVCRRQVLAAGFTDEAIGVRLQAGRWRRLYPGVYATFSGPVPSEARRWAALLHAGAGAMLSHQTAAELVGLSNGGSGEIHVTIPASRRVGRIPGVVVHRSRRTAELVHPARRPPQTRVEETVLDLTQTAATLDDAIGWLARACGGRLTTPGRLAKALAVRRRVRWRSELLSAVEDVRAGCHSLLELRYLRNVERKHALPTATRQRARPRRGGRWYDDVRYQRYGTMVELDGRAAHPDESRWRDMHRDNAGVANGLSVLRYGTAAVSDRPCEVAVQVAAVLLRNGWAGPPRPCGPQCPVPSI